MILAALDGGASHIPIGHQVAGRCGATFRDVGVVDGELIGRVLERDRPAADAVPPPRRRRADLAAERDRAAELAAPAAVYHAGGDDTALVPPPAMESPAGLAARLRRRPSTSLTMRRPRRIRKGTSGGRLPNCARSQAQP